MFSKAPPINRMLRKRSPAFSGFYAAQFGYKWPVNLPGQPKSMYLPHLRHVQFLRQKKDRRLLTARLVALNERPLPRMKVWRYWSRDQDLLPEDPDDPTEILKP